VNSIKDNFNELISLKINDYEEKLELENDNTKTLHINNKYYKIAYLDRIVKEMGFASILDKEEINIDKNKIINYINLYKNKISNLFVTNEIKFENNNINLLFKEILRYINQRLSSMFKINIKHNKKNNKYYISGLDFWCEEINPFKVTDIDMILNELLNEFNIGQD
jgi:GTPase SAR1 family protein